MKKRVLTIVPLALFCSCTKKASVKEIKPDAVKIERHTAVEVRLDTAADHAKRKPPKIEKDTSLFKILMPVSYRWNNLTDPAAELSESWRELYEQDGKFLIGKAKFTKEYGSDECSGDSVTTLSSSRETIFYMDSDSFSEGELTAASAWSRDEIVPGSAFDITFRNEKFTLRAEGESDGTDFRGYTLIISTAGSETVLDFQDEMEDSRYSLLFAGDLDGDSKLDLVFSAPRHYEENRIIVFLSSHSRSGIMRKSAENQRSFDC